MWFSSLVQGIKSTLKSEDTEGFFEIYVTRSCGYLWALFFKQLHIHPNVVTIVSIILGALSGYMFYYDDLSHTLWGISFPSYEQVAHLHNHTNLPISVKKYPTEYEINHHNKTYTPTRLLI